MNTTRRRFLQAAGTVSLCLADGTALQGLAAFAAEPPPERIQFGPDLEPVVRLMEETPRDQCVRVFLDELQRGLPYRRFLAASLFAGIRRVHSNHEVYKIHAVHQVGMDVRPEERLLPLFWALNGPCIPTPRPTPCTMRSARRRNPRRVCSCCCRPSPG